MEQTPVMWLVEQIFGDHTDAWKEEIEQALEMERLKTREIYLKKAMEKSKLLPKVDKSKIERYS